MTIDRGPERRALLEGAAGDIFREIVAGDPLAPDDPRLSPTHPDHDAVALLIELGLLREDPTAHGYVAADPAQVQAGVVAPMGREVVALLDESAAWADTFGALSQAYRRTPSRGSAFAQIRGLPAIDRFIEAAVDDAETELLTAQPAGARKQVVLNTAIDRDLRALDRGVSMRTLDEFFNRLIVIDRRLAIIPGAQAVQDDVAVAIQDRNMVAYLIDIFDRSWERAREYDDHEASSESDIAAEVRQLTVRMLTEGHSDPASAKRVGVSTRTYASYVAALKDEYGVQTRFQLGYAMGVQDRGETGKE